MKKRITILMAAMLLLSGLTWAQTTLNISDYASANNWTNGTQYLTATMDDVTFTAAGGGNTGKYYTNDQTWRFYANEGATLTISVPSGSSLVTVTPTFTSKDNGTLLYADSAIESGADVSVSGESAVFAISQSSGNKGKIFFTEIEVTYTSGGAPTPSITAANVDIAYDATSGAIEYTINNGVSGGVLTATTTAEWLTIGTVGTTVPFTCSANQTTAPRTASVTLTYTYNTDHTATKNITVTQAANPNAVNNISDITAAGTYSVQGTIVAKSARGFIVGDGTGYVYYYNQNYTQADYNIGDMVKLAGPVVVYGGVFEFNSSTTITAATSSNYVAGDPTVLTGEDMDARVASTTPPDLSNYVQFEGSLSVNETHYNIYPEGATTAIGSISYPLNTEDITALDGKTVKVTGYYVGISSSTYYNIMLGNIEEVVGSVAIPTFNPAAGSYSEAQSVTISCATENASIYYTLDGTDPDNSSTLYNGPITVSTTTTIKAIAYDGAGNSSAIATATYTILVPITIAEARAQATGDVYTMGTVTSFSVNNSNKTTAYIQDGTAAIVVFGEFTVAVGDEISVTGTLSDYNGLLEITNPTVTVISSGNTVNPQLMTIAEVIASTNQGWYIRVEEATVTAISGQNTTIAQGDNTIVVRGISGVEYAVNDVLSLNGNIGYYNGNQIAHPTDVTVQQNTEPSITVDPTTINAPFAGAEGTLTVTYDNLSSEDAEVYFCDAQAMPATYDWITAEINDEFNVHYSIAANQGEARTAYLMVVVGEIASSLVTINQAEYVTPPTPGDWVLTDLADLTEDDVFVIVGTYEDPEHDSYAMSNNNGTSKAPDAVGVVVAENTLSGEIADTLQWNIRITDDGFMFYPNGDTTTWLYCTNTNNGVRVGTNSNNIFNLTDEGYLQNDATGRYLGIYNTQDWRCYSTINSNIEGQSFAFYKKVTSSTTTQTVNLIAGTNWFSTYLEITLADLQDALKTALGNNASITIKSQTQSCTLKRGQWQGQLTSMDVAQMYKIVVATPCEFTLEGEPINPADHPITIEEGTTVYIGYPLSQGMAVANVFTSNFIVNADQLKSQTLSTTVKRGSWNGQLTELEPGQGYIYKPAAGSGTRTFTFPASTK